MKEFIEALIARGGYKLDELEVKIKKLFVLGDLTEEEMEALLKLAADSVDNSAQVDLYDRIDTLERRIKIREDIMQGASDYAVWTPGKKTLKGEIVRIDLDGDGTLDYAMYDGGRSDGTSLKVGQIDGWYKVTPAGSKTHIITRNSDGTYTLTEI